MRQNSLADEFEPGMAESKNADQPRALTHDEKKPQKRHFEMSLSIPLGL